MDGLFRQPSSLETYEHYRSQIKTGDVIAFEGESGFSDLIKWATKSKYSHVGIVLKVDLSGGFGKSVLIIESTTETNYLDANNREVIKGVQLHWLSKRIKMYNGSVYWVPLKQPLSPEGTKKMEAWLRETHNQRVPYDMVQVAGAGLDLFDRLGIANEEDMSRLFCSELVTKALKIAGAVDASVNASEQTPKDVVEFNCLREPITLKQHLFF